MRPDDIRRLLQQKPFRPFRLYVLETTTYEVRHPDAVMVGQSTMTLITPVSGATLPLAQPTVTIALLHITKIEPLVPEAPSGNGSPG